MVGKGGVDRLIKRYDTIGSNLKNEYALESSKVQRCKNNEYNQHLTGDVFNIVSTSITKISLII